MAYYRLYFLRDEHIRGVEEIDAASDSEAMARCEQYRGDDALELWNERRKVGRIEAIDLASRLLAGRRDERAAAEAAAQDQAQKA